MSDTPSRYVPGRVARVAYLSDQDRQTVAIADWLDEWGFGAAAIALRTNVRPTEIITLAEAMKAANAKDVLISPVAKVRIYSTEHGMYWRPNASGYTQCRVTAGVYSFTDAVKQTSHCGPEKGIEFEVVP